MAFLPPRKGSAIASSKVKQNASPLQVLLQMGFPKQRALKALAATGYRSVQLASDWILTHVNDAQLDSDEPREYIYYATPTGPLLKQLLEFWEKSKAIAGWNGAHNFRPHITLVSFFKAPDEVSLQLAKTAKHAVEKVGPPPNCPLKLEPYVSHNFMGLFVSEEHAEYLKKVAVQYVKDVSSVLGVPVDTYDNLNTLGTCFPWCTMPQGKSNKSAINLEAHVKSLYITLAYHFDESAYELLKTLVDELQPMDHSHWELRLYSRDPRFANRQVFKVTQGYAPRATDELELVLGDYIYIDEKEFDSSPDGWVQGTSWLTGVSGYLPVVLTRRTAESDSWTLHRALLLANVHTSADRSKSTDSSKSETNLNADSEMSSSYPHEDAAALAHDKSEEVYKEWNKFWHALDKNKIENGIMNVSQENWKCNPQTSCDGEKSKSESDKDRRWILTMRHGERVDLTYGQWVDFCFDKQGNYTRKDLNLPLKLGPRSGGHGMYALDSPLTRVGRFQAWLLGEGLRHAGVPLAHVYASASLRCVETAHALLQGLEADPSVKIRVEPGLFEYKNWYLSKGMAPFMTPQELYDHGLNVDLDYKPYLELEVNTPETLEDFYKRGETVVHSVLKDTAKQGGNIMFVAHAATLDITSIAIKRLAGDKPVEEYPPYQIHHNLLRVPYCALGAARDNPLEIVCPPCPPSVNSSSGRFDWRILADVV